MRNQNLFDLQSESLKSYKPIGFWKKFKFNFKKLDMYALPITLRYKNQRKFYTNAGALMSLLIYVSIILILLNSLDSVLNKD